MYFLDLHDALYWIIRTEHQQWPAGGDKQLAQSIIQRLNDAHRPNIEMRDENLYICYGDHERSQACRFELAVENVYARPTQLPRPS